MIGQAVRALGRRIKRVFGEIAGTRPARHIQIQRPCEFHGSAYGGWWVCASSLTSESIVYSVGVGTDVTFDLSLIHRYGLCVFAFDPTPRCNEWVKEQNLPDAFRFHPLGLAAYDGTATFHPPDNETHVSFSVTRTSHSGTRGVEARVARLRTIMDQLGHSHIDLLKLDIEGAEYDVIQDLCDSQVPIGQLLIEFHFGRGYVTVDKVNETLTALRRFGYRVFKVSDTGHEYSLIRCI